MTLIPWILLLLAVALQLVTLPVLLRRKDPEAALKEITNNKDLTLNLDTTKKSS